MRPSARCVKTEARAYPRRHPRTHPDGGTRSRPTYLLTPPFGPSLRPTGSRSRRYPFLSREADAGLKCLKGRRCTSTSRSDRDPQATEMHDVCTSSAWLTTPRSGRPRPRIALDGLCLLLPSKLLPQPSAGREVLRRVYFLGGPCPKGPGCVGSHTAPLPAEDDPSTASVPNPPDEARLPPPPSPTASQMRAPP